MSWIWDFAEQKQSSTVPIAEITSDGVDALCAILSLHVVQFKPPASAFTIFGVVCCVGLLPCVVFLPG